MKMIGNVSDWLSYAGGALIKVADSAGSTVTTCLIFNFNMFQVLSTYNFNLKLGYTYIDYMLKIA